MKKNENEGEATIKFDKKANRINSLFGNFGQSESEDALLILLKILFLKKRFHRNQIKMWNW